MDGERGKRGRKHTEPIHNQSMTALIINHSPYYMCSEVTDNSRTQHLRKAGWNGNLLRRGNPFTQGRTVRVTARTKRKMYGEEIE